MRNITMAADAIKLQIELLKMQIELQESNYQSAIQLQKDYETLRHLREHIRELKETLASLNIEDETTEPAS